MIAEITGLIVAITALVAVVGFIFILYKPPKGLKWFKLKDYFEGKFDNDRSALPPASAPVATQESGATEAAPPPTALEAAQAEAGATPLAADSQAKAAESEEVAGWEAILAAFKEHDYIGGLKRARLYVASSDSKGRYNTEAFFLWVAYIQGNTEAYGDAEQLAAKHPQDFDAQYFWGHISGRIGKTEQAITLYKKAMSLAGTQNDRVSAAKSLQAALTRVERYKEALDMLREQLSQTESPELRAELLVAMARTYEAAPSDHRAAFVMYELAIQNVPDDAKLRFDVAYKYGDRSANELAFVHYRRLLEDEPDHVMATNNIGAAADGLQLPLTAVSYYKSAKSKDNTLASSNLANILITAGFKEEAEQILAEAKTKSGVHRNVSLAIGRLAQSEVNEENSIEQISERVGKVRKWHVQHAEALLRTIDPVTLSGSYLGVPTGLDLTVQPDGTATGKFNLSDSLLAVLTGTVNGAVLTFRWTSERKDKDFVAAYLGRKTGHGVLIAKADGAELDGYWTEGSETIDSKDFDKWTQWHLAKALAKQTG